MTSQDVLMLVGGITANGSDEPHNAKYYLYSRSSGEWDSGRVRNTFCMRHAGKNDAGVKLTGYLP